MIDPIIVEKVLTVVATVAGTVAAIKTDIRWIKRWTREHAASDSEHFGEIRDRLGHVEETLLAGKK